MKIRNRLWSMIVMKLRKSNAYKFIYKSYIWSLFIKPKTNLNSNMFFTARPNPGAGIGHQMANWIAGYWWAKQFGLQYAHSPFSTMEWERFLDFGRDEITVADLKKQGYKTVLIPLFDEKNDIEIELTRRIISSYANKKVIFVCEQDQSYRNQFGVMQEIQEKFHNAEIRKTEQLIYKSANYNIAIHVRRGDIVAGQTNKNPNLLMRWQNNDYFTTVLANALRLFETEMQVHIYLFSQGNENDFADFKTFENLHFCLDMNPQDSFLHMVYADMLITSKSSFSYKPALLNKGIKVCPASFWHGYPDGQDWVLADEDGNIIKK